MQAQVFLPNSMTLPQIPVDYLVQQLQGIPGIRVFVDMPDINGFNYNSRFKDWATHWLETYKKGVVKDNTYLGTAWEPVMLHLVPYFGDRLLNSIKLDDVQTFFKTLTDKLALETQTKIRVALRAIYEAAIEHHICCENPVKKSLKLTSAIPPKVKQAWTAKQCNTAYEFALTHPAGLDVITLLETAISRSELLGLTPADHDYKNSALIIENGLVFQKSTVTGRYGLVHEGVKNKYRRRIIPISPFLNEAIKAKPKTIYVGGNKKTGTEPHKVTPQYLFHAPDGGPYNPTNWYKRVLKKFMRDLHESHPEVPALTTHELRHTRTTRLANGGKDLFLVAKLLGHSGLDMIAKRYAHGELESLRTLLGIDNQV